jgi:hypothetical protein
MIRRSWVLMAATALVAMAATTAHAAAVPLTSRTLFATKSVADALPAQLVYDSFTSASPVALNSRNADTGQPWTMLQGALQVNGGYLRCTTCGGGNYSAAVADADLARVTASVEVRSAFGSGAGGLVLNATATGSQAYALWYDAGVVTLLRFVAGTATFVATANVATPPNNVDVPLSATFNGTSYTVSFNGTQVLTYTMPVADRATFGVSTYFGLVVYDDANIVRLDDFRVTK